jgi:chitodextrinase
MPLTTPVTFPDITPPSVPAKVTANAASASEIDLAWQASTDDVGVSSYKIYVNGANPLTPYSNGAEITQLNASTNYSFGIAACDLAGNCSAQSALSYATTLAPPVQPAAGYWWNPATPGSGFVIEVQGMNLFMGGFLYAASGEATWVASTGPMTSSSQYSGSLVTYSGGQTLTGSYLAPALNASSPGNIAMTFTDDSHGMLTWPGGTISIERFDFGPGGSETA